MVINFVRALRSEEVWVGAVVVIGGNGFAIQGKSDEVFHVGIGLGVWVVFEMSLSSFVKVIYFFVAFRDCILV